MTFVIPAWDLGDRLRKALDHSGKSAKQMAAYLGVAPQTVSNWLNGHHSPSTATMRLWSMATGVSYEWLVAGDVGAFQAAALSEAADRFEDLRAHGPSCTCAECAARDLNPQPADYWPAAA